MKLDKLPYQQDAIKAVVEAIGEVCANEESRANPLLIDTEGIDVKMETGTGKTYVYTRLMHELKQRFGFFKFIIIVPSVAIKEGTKMSIRSGEWNRHFRAEFANQSITLAVINAGDFDSKKGKRKAIPEALRSFCDSTRAEANTVQVLLLNDAMLSSVSMTRNDYDTTLFGSISCPIEGLQATRPIVIIDEPHRFNKDNKAWKNIMEGLQPQLIIRFGATFPDKKIGKEKGKDYERGKPVYDLNAVRAFNDNLVKGVEIVYPALENKETKRYKITEVTKKGITIGGKEVGLDESLSAVDPKFEGLRLENEGGKLQLSNGLAVETGMELVPDLFTMDYQSLLLGQALDAHFEKERENFRRTNRIKTNSLFFIDSIASFRGENAWLRTKFEELLTVKLTKEIAEATGAYREFLEASLRNISACSAGYFAEDNKKGDEAIQTEVDNILRNKEQSLTFKNAAGEWNVCRFFFSKWTLCEGWDNPNVFVIAKLRSSGSEIRKLQEVGRGLRLPFDEHGKRISNENETFYLTYIIDYSERDFARKLLGEINADGGVLQDNKVTEHLLGLLVNAGYAESSDMAFAGLMVAKIIDRGGAILDMDKFIALLSEDSGVSVKKGKIVGEGLPAQPKVRLNKGNFEKLRTLWNQVTKRYLLQFERVGEAELHRIFSEVLTDEVFVAPIIEIKTERIAKGDENVRLVAGGYDSAYSQSNIIPYGAFLQRLGKETNLSVGLLHKTIVEARRGKETPAELFNLNSLAQIVMAFSQRFREVFAQRFKYIPLDFMAETSIFEPGTDMREFKYELAQGLVGVSEDKDIDRPKDNYLYDKYVYDQELEHEVLKVNPPARVVVYGKLPRKSIQLPTYTGGTTSPDFVYAICGEDPGEISIHFIVETKSDNPRESDKVAVEAQRRFFEQMSVKKIQWKMETDVNTFEQDLKGLAE